MLGEVQAIVTDGESDPRSAGEPADRILSTKEQVNLAIPDDGGRIEDVFLIGCTELPFSIATILGILVALCILHS